MLLSLHLAYCTRLYSQITLGLLQLGIGTICKVTSK